MSKVLVIGDSCVDVFEYGSCSRICPEAPVPVLIPTNKKENYGMSMNVYENLIGLGVDCDIITNDIKPIKTRYIDEVSNQMIIRIDSNDKIDPIKWDRLEQINFEEYEAIVISDYNKGFLSNDHIKFISRSHNLVFLDSKKKISKWANNVTFIKINEKEFLENERYLTNDYPSDVIVTLGKRGAKLIFNGMDEIVEKEFPIKHKHNVRDLTGAGDTFMASLVAKYITTCNIDESIEFANRCAAWAVTQKGIAVVNMNKIENDGYQK